MELKEIFVINAKMKILYTKQLSDLINVSSSVSLKILPPLLVLSERFEKKSLFSTH